MALAVPVGSGEKGGQGGSAARKGTSLKVILEIRCQKCDIFGTRKRTNGILPINCRVVNIIHVAVKWIGEIPI